jgi:hypothetical protein
MAQGKPVASGNYDYDEKWSIHELRDSAHLIRAEQDLDSSRYTGEAWLDARRHYSAPGV